MIDDNLAPPEYIEKVRQDTRLAGYELSDSQVRAMANIYLYFSLIGQPIAVPPGLLLHNLVGPPKYDISENANSGE